MKRDFTATVYLVHDDKMLLVFHKKLKVWLPPGGHIHEGELPEEAAIREVKEETGLDINIISEKQPVLDGKVTPLFRPDLIQLEDIDQDNDFHQHIDLFYYAVLKDPTKVNNMTMHKDELDDIRWFTVEEMEKEGVAEDIKYNAKLLIEKVKKVHQ